MYFPSDYDRHGALKLPVLFWVVLLLQARTWVLFVMAGASRDQGDALLNLFYPDHDNFWWGLLPGVPAVITFLISGRRQSWPRLWGTLRWLLILAQCVLVLWQPLLWYSGEAVSGTALALVILDAYALWFLLVHPRLRACFSTQTD
ncbi:DUF2919 domain-containing protein [Superficieibacter sp.]|uniref:DUF2919 domain-containing protein n=1 Tax=Superficieibacter sp. TaxID=2303322 RepID=UPI0028AD208B|nr:DUF2919 domain-containing protein [Superficieibacter sp.]